MWFCNHVRLVVRCMWYVNVVGLVVGFEWVDNVVVFGNVVGLITRRGPGHSTMVNDGVTFNFILETMFFS